MAAKKQLRSQKSGIDRCQIFSDIFRWFSSYCSSLYDLSLFGLQLSAIFDLPVFDESPCEPPDISIYLSGSSCPPQPALCLGRCADTSVKTKLNWSCTGAHPALAVITTRLLYDAVEHVLSTMLCLSTPGNSGSTLKRWRRSRRQR